MKKITLCLLLFLDILMVRAQQPADTLAARQQLAALGSDTARLSLLQQLASQSRQSDLPLSFRYGREGLGLARKIKEPVRIAAFYMVLGNNHTAALEYDKGLVYLDSAYKLFKEIRDSAGMARALSNTGATYQRQSNLVAAVRYFTDAYNIAEAAGDAKNMILAGYNIAVTYADQQNGSKSLEYALKVLQLVRQYKDEKKLGMSLGAVAEGYRLVNDTVNAGKYFALAVQEYERRGDDYGVAAAYTNWALVTRDVRKEMEYQTKAQAYWDASGTEDLMVVANLGNLGARYYDLYKNDVLNGLYGNREQLLHKAEELIQRSVTMAEHLQSWSYLPDPLRSLAAIQYTKGNFKGAYESLNKAYLINDTIFSQANKNRIAALESEQKIERRDKEIRIGKLALEGQRRLTLALVAVVLLLAVIGIMFYRLSLTRKSANAQLMRLNTDLDEASRLKTRFLGILSHDLRSPVARLVNFLRLEKESPGLMDKAASEAYAGKIRLSAEHLLDTMESVLLWSKGQMEQFTPSPETISAAGLFEDIRRYCEGISGIGLTFDDPQRLTLHTDPEFVKTIMRNLTDNAIKAVSQNTTAHILWTAGTYKGRPSLSITDNGPGTDKQKLQALFDERTAVIARNGLGFHLVRDMAKAIGCTIEAEINEVERGTTFYLLFPA